MPRLRAVVRPARARRLSGVRERPSVSVDATRLLDLDPAEAVRQDPDRAQRIADRVREKGHAEAAEAIEARIRMAQEGEL